jgi:hypothetical protein
MKNLLTEKNLMWASIALLAALQFGLVPTFGEDRGAREGRGSQIRQRMERMGSMGDRGKGAWIKEKKDGVKEGRKKAPKDAE